MSFQRSCLDGKKNKKRKTISITIKNFTTIVINTI